MTLPLIVNARAVKNFSFKLDLCIDYLHVSDFRKLVTLTIKVKSAVKLATYLSYTLKFGFFLVYLLI